MGSVATMPGQCELPLAMPTPRAAAMPGPNSRADLNEINIGGRTLRPTPVFDTYWRFAAERQTIYDARMAGRPGPWTRDPVLLRHRFTNCFRALTASASF